MSWDMNNLYEWTMLENLPVGSIERVKNSFQFKEHEENDAGYFFEFDIQYPKR